MRIGLVCPYPWDVPGGVQAHVRDLAEALLARGHEVSVIAPVEGDGPWPDYLVAAGSAVAVKFNGSTARLAMGPTSAARVRRWVRDGGFDVLHVHSPEAPSLGMLACLTATGPIVATFHASNPRSRVLVALSGAFQTQLEKITGRIAVSAAARRTIVEHLGGDAVVIPNGVDVAAFATAEPLDGWPGDGGALGFLGRLEEPRKGLAVLLAALPSMLATRPGLRVLLAGPGDAESALGGLPAAVRERITVLGLVSEQDKARFYRSVDVYVAPNTGGESFGIVLLEAMAAGTSVACSDLDAFRRVLADGGDGDGAGVVFEVGDGPDLARACLRLLDEPGLRADVRGRGRAVAARYDWAVVTEQILAVYETVAVVGVGVTEDRRDPAAQAPGWWRLRERLAEWREAHPDPADDPDLDDADPDDEALAR